MRCDCPQKSLRRGASPSVRSEDLELSGEGARREGKITSPRSRRLKYLRESLGKKFPPPPARMQGEL